MAIPLRVAIPILCAMLVVTCSVAVFTLSYTSSLKAVGSVVSTYAASLAADVRSEVVNFLTAPLGTVEGWQFMTQQHHFPLPHDAEQLGSAEWFMEWWHRFVIPMRASKFAFQFAVFGFDDGNYVGCKNLDVPYFQCRAFLTRRRALTGRSSVVEQTYERTTHAVVTESDTGTTVYDPRLRSWYHMVDHRPSARAWSSVYLSAIPTLPVIDINAAVFNQSGTFLGVASLTFELGYLTEYLNQIHVTPRTVAVLLDNDGLLMASTFAAPFMTTTPIAPNDTRAVPSHCIRSDSSNGATSSVETCREGATSYAYEPLRQLATQLPSLLQNGTGGAVVLTLAGESMFVAVERVTTAAATGMQWSFVLFIPEDDVLGDVLRTRNIVIGVSLAILLAAVLGSVIASIVLLHPLSDLAESLAHSATLNVEAMPIMRRSAFTEVAHIQAAYSNLAAELLKLRAFVPPSVLATLAAGGEDEYDAEETIVTSDVGTSHELPPLPPSLPSSKRRSDHSSVYKPRSVVTMGSRATSNALQRPTPALNTSLHLANRTVSVLSFNLTGFRKLVRGSSSTEMVLRHHATIVGCVTDAITEARGVLYSMLGDRFLVTFNAVTPVGNHAMAAVQCALNAADRLAQLQLSVCVSAGVATGDALVGNSGNVKASSFCVLGDVVVQAAVLERLCKRYDPVPKVLAFGRAVIDVLTFADVVAVDVVSLPYVGRRVISAVVSLRPQVECDEWIYELQRGGVVSSASRVNAAFDAALGGRLDVAATAAMTASELQVTCTCPSSPLELAAVQRVLRVLSPTADVAPSRYTCAMGEYYDKCIAACSPEEEKSGKTARNNATG